MGSWNSKLWTFVIGLVAGAAPFLCMSYLPHLLDPGAAISRPDLAAVLIVGLLVGFVTVIMDAKRFDHEDPKEVLMRALAIPSILLATVTGLQSRQIVTEQRASASAHVDTTLSDVNIMPAGGALQDVTSVVGGGTRTSWLWGPRAALAQPVARPVRRAVVAAGPRADYIVSLGTYATREAAAKAAERWGHPNALATERYYQKAIRVFTAGEKLFYVSYTTRLPRAEAVKLFKLIRINDPTVTPQILQFTEGA